MESKTKKLIFSKWWFVFWRRKWTVILYVVLSSRTSLLSTFNRKLFVPLKKSAESVQKLPNLSVFQVNLKICIPTVSSEVDHKCTKIIRNKSTMAVFHFFWQNKVAEMLRVLQVFQKKVWCSTYRERYSYAFIVSKNAKF